MEVEECPPEWAEKLFFDVLQDDLNAELYTEEDEEDKEEDLDWATTCNSKEPTASSKWASIPVSPKECRWWCKP